MSDQDCAMALELDEEPNKSDGSVMFDWGWICLTWDLCHESGT
jgi:hypothetical protein